QDIGWLTIALPAEYDRALGRYYYLRYFAIRSIAVFIAKTFRLDIGRFFTTRVVFIALHFMHRAQPGIGLLNLPQRRILKLLAETRFIQLSQLPHIVIGKYYFSLGGYRLQTFTAVAAVIVCTDPGQIIRRIIAGTDTLTCFIVAVLLNIAL